MTAADDLDTITDRWTTLQERAGTRPSTTWPPAMGITRLMTDEERADQAAERADTAPDAPGPRPTPVDVNVLDVMTTIETGLVTAADWLANRIQRPAFTAPTGRGWNDDTHRAAVLLAAKDAADPRRWTYTGARTAPDAAEWLALRLRDAPGPFRRLDEGERQAVAAVASSGAELIRKTLGDARQRTTVPHPCPGCAGQLVVEGGDGTPPVVLCEDCGRTWTETTAGAA
ncbi:hypothetical protein [Streptomyces sp. SID161]|uniref:hypothetical protein n=1 Tax=Streptomyces sp. SID161 TaxID=2690251 RepID=UPI0013694854|nr:hypothetical protein [Streptomyces sp. SID161]MYW48858.1 hypothetical protein [Streptomyces sp. SID161]MYW49857.1 hypothetical protein [Streptomyces sp. SID161]